MNGTFAPPMQAVSGRAAVWTSATEATRARTREIVGQAGRLDTDRARQRQAAIVGNVRHGAVGFAGHRLAHTRGGGRNGRPGGDEP